MRDDLERLQGTWRVSSLELEGKQMPDTMLADAEITIRGQRFTSKGMGAVYKGVLKLDPSSKPARLDMKFDAGPEKGNTNLGIYVLQGNTLKLCLATRGKIRPSRFESSPGSGFAFEVLSRGKPKAAPKAKEIIRLQHAATEFEGEW